MLHNINLMTFKGVYTYIFSYIFSPKPPDKIRPVCWLTHSSMSFSKDLTLLTFYSAPSQLAPSASKLRNKTPALRKERKVRRMAHRDWEKGRSRGRGEIVFLGSKAIFLPSTLIHSLCATLAPGGIRVACHWCHSPVNQSVTGSMLWSGNSQPRGTWDEVTTCLC